MLLFVKLKGVKIWQKREVSWMNLKHLSLVAV